MNAALASNSEAGLASNNEAFHISQLKFLERQIIEVTLRCDELTIRFRNQELAERFAALSSQHLLVMECDEKATHLGLVSDLIAKDTAVLIKDRIWVVLPSTPSEMTLYIGRVGEKISLPFEIKIR